MVYVPAYGVAPCVDRGQVEHDMASAGEGERVTVMVRRLPHAHGGGRQGVGSGLSPLGIGIVGDSQFHPVRERCGMSSRSPDTSTFPAGVTGVSFSTLTVPSAVLLHRVSLPLS